MQAAQVLSHTLTSDSRSVTECAEMDGKLSETFAGKLKFNGDFSGGLDNKSQEIEEEDEGGGESDGDDDFSFVCLNPDGSLVSADDLFHDGQIRPVFSIFNRDLLFSDATDGDLAVNEVLSLQPNIKKVFIEEQNVLTSSGSQELAPVAAGTNSEWSRKSAEKSSEPCKKSNSTGFSKLWRFRELVHHRSNSDGNDAFVFLNNPSTTGAGKSNKEKAQETDKVLKKKEKIGEERRSGDGEIRAKDKEVMRGKTASSMHHKPYARAGSRGQKEGSKRKSHLPYRQVLGGVGFFTSVNGLSRNVHPF